MKRDMDMVRQLLLDAEAHDNKPPFLATDEPNAVYHISLLNEAGLMNAIIRKNEYGLPGDAVIMGLTWAGHDFLAAARDDTIWKKAKDVMLKPGISWTFSILTEWLKQEAHKRFFGVSQSS
jgi:hypothetical protein